MNFNPFKNGKGTSQQKTEQQIQRIINGRQPVGEGVHNNPNFEVFNRVNTDIAAIINSRSVVSQASQQQNRMYANPTGMVSFGEDFMAVPVATNKSQRISMYRNIAEYPICRWCLDEIADDFIHSDSDGEFITLKLPDRLNAQQQDIIQNEFHKFMDLFRLRDDGYNVVKRFLTEGELAWENVINPNYPDMGIVGVKFLPSEYYETLLDPDTSMPVGIAFDTEQFTNDKRQMFINSFAGSASIFNSIAPTTYNFNINRETCVPLLWNQITYINSGEYSHDYMISYPIIENAKQQYHRLALLENSAVILRVTHAPERLLFNVSTGKMTQNYADEYVRRFAMDLKSKKSATPDGSDIIGTYNPVTMLKSYVFGKSDGNDGTSVESVGSSASYDQMEDIEYFLRALLKQFKVPWSRYKTPENTIEKNDNITYEEYAFSRMIIRFQRRFADGFKRSFITHLKLRDIWEKDGYDLIESDIDIEFMRPVLYDQYEIQKQVESKMAVYTTFADRDEISKILMMKKYLGFSDAEIEENYKNIIKEKQLVAVGDFFAEQITAENPPVDFKSPIRLKNDVVAEETVKAGVPKDANAEGTAGDEGSDNATGDGGEESDEEVPSEEGGDEDAGIGEPATASFGLG